ncbi:ABC transporter permease [Mucilaginibacter ginsenosidivorax]|uniref:FtsX-like permease family protein n=1 Tax=Mucilaginibacter ginsenosidivorax TaxID=862126 RepID=A0A5B8WAL5_9SPHI|nr:ABC transporter permease [Mucilaginibacter ginsenosidivorax]QEC79832.1 FtsX-like permease family protein [Mucilaginibacter ginsenosidivorax]
MLKNYIKIAWRNLIKHKVFSIINVSGLAIGVAAFWLISLYVADEWSYDRYNEKSDRIFQVAQHGKWNGGSFNLAVTSPPYSQALKADYPEVEEAVRVDLEGGGKIVYNEKQVEAGDISFTDKSIFNVFTYHFLAGDPSTALVKPQSIVLTKTLAEKIFGPDISSAIDKVITFEGEVQNTVTGVIDDVPQNSTFKFSALRSFNADYNGNWGNAGIYTFVLLKDHDDYKKIEARSSDFYNKYLKQNLAGVTYKLELLPLTAIHLHSSLDYQMGNNGNVAYLYVFGIVGLLILSIAVINYVNLTTARSSVRIKEIGTRKVIGSGRLQLLYMFFTESILLAVLATIAGMVLIQAALPYVNMLSGKSLQLWYFGVTKSLVVFALFAVVTGVVSGIYPALFLSGFKTISAMKGQLGNQSSTILFRKGLVVFQFVITILMIIGSCVIYQQLNFVLTKDLGFNKSQMLTFHIRNRDVRAKTDEIKTQLLQSPLIQSVAVAGNPIGNNDIGSTYFSIGADGKKGPDSKLVESLIIDEDFLPAMQIKMAAGRNFMKGPADTANHSILVNETLVKEMGWKNPVGARVRSGIDHGVVTYATVIGVVKDFNTYSLQHKISPMVLSLPSETKDKDNLYVRLGQGNVQAAINYLQKVYARFDPENKADYNFLDQNFAAQYQTEQKQGKLLFVFTILAIGIACLGLFGLITFTAEQRVKEIGIRKVLGASIASIVKLLSQDLMKLVLLAALIASPLAWYSMSKWLQSFAYRVEIQWWIFLLAGVIATVIAFLTVSARSIRAATVNPAKSLKSE